MTMVDAVRSHNRFYMLKSAATLVKAADGYTVVRGDTLSGIASRNGTTWQELARLNGMKNPNLLRIGQSIALPPPVDNATPTQRLDRISAYLHKRLNNPNLESALLANFNTETGGKFDYRTKEIGGGGWGIPQYTGTSLKAYKNWLAAKKFQDSERNQLDYFIDKYMPSRYGYKTYMSPGARFTREQYADWLHKRVFTPAHTIKSNPAYSQAKIDKRTLAHSDFMNNKIKQVNGVWKGI